MPALPNIVVVVVDRLGAGWLGPYGNTWIPTPGINRLAANSVLCEFMQSDSHQLVTVYRSYLTGLAAWSSAQPATTLMSLVQASGYNTRLLTDDETLARHALSETCNEVEWTNPPHAKRLASEIQGTLLWDFFNYAGSGLAKLKQPTLLWLHTGAMNLAWDAPYELRQQLAAEEDPDPPESVEVPALQLTKNHDPDLLLGIVQSYAAQIVALDHCLASFLSQLDKVLNPAETLVVFTSPRGLAVGEHLQVGTLGDSLRGEVLQVPLMIRLPEQRGRLTRLASLHQPSDLFQVLSDAVSGRSIDANQLLPHREPSFVVSSADDELAIRTLAWFYRQSGSGEQRHSELYAKPDDRWEMNEVSARAGDIMSGFEQFSEWLQQQRHLPVLPSLPELPPELFQALR